MYDALDIANFSAEESGITSDSYPPFYVDGTELPSLAFNEWGQIGYATAGLYQVNWDNFLAARKIILKFISPVGLTKLVLRESCGYPSVALVGPLNTFDDKLGLYSYAYGDVNRTSRVTDSVVIDGVAKNVYTSTWDFSEFETALIVIGSGGGDYPQEKSSFITGLWTEPAIDIPAGSFWTNFRGQYETK